MNSVSVIIPVYNAAATIGRALDALARQDLAGPFDIIVVDDGSTDATAAVVRRYPSVRYVHQPNAGPASARNHGARLAQGEFLCFTDSDCVPHTDWIYKLLDGFKNGANIAVVMGSYGIANPQSVLARGIHAEIVFRHRYLMPDFPKAFGSYNFCVRKNVFFGVGGFNETYRSASGEDNDLSYKIIRAGHRIFFQRRALVDHHHTTNVIRYLKEQCRHGYWRARTYADHPSMTAGDGYTYWKDILEMPWAAVCIGGVAVLWWKIVTLKSALFFLIFPLWCFEVYCAWRMTRDFFDGIFFGNVIFFRAFARLFGLSSGISAFFVPKCRKKIK